MRSSCFSSPPPIATPSTSASDPRAWVDDVNERAAAAGLANLHAVFAHINDDLPLLFALHPVRRFFINFPDPWFKRRQHNRRIVTPELAADLSRLLAPDGELFFQSDVFDLALDAMAVLESEPRLRNNRAEWSFLPGNPYGAQSLREERVLARGCRCGGCGICRWVRPPHVRRRARPRAARRAVG